MNTRRYPRTLNEAFGPYSSGPIHDPDERHFTLFGAALLAAGIVVEIAIVAFFVFHAFTQ